MRIALIGAGRIAKVHARSIAAHPDTTLSLVADPNKQAAQDLAESYGAQWCTDATQAIVSSEVDAVIICSPTPLHADQILTAARAGKPVLCEKPVAMDIPTVDKLVADLEGLDARVMLGFNRRFDPSFARIHQLVADGVAGTVEQVTIISRDPAAPPREYIATSGGIFKDMTIHDFDMARFFLGDITSVVAIGQHLDPELADTGDFDGAIITLTNADGVTATITNSRHCASGYDQRLEVFGNKATLNADNIRDTTVQVSTADYTDARDPYLDFFLARYEAAYQRELEEFVDAVTTGRMPSPSIADGAAALAIAEAAEESARTGIIVHL